MRFLPAADMAVRFFLAGLEAIDVTDLRLVDPGGRPRRFCGWLEVRIVRACCRRAISVSIADSRAVIFMGSNITADKTEGGVVEDLGNRTLNCLRYF